MASALAQEQYWVDKSRFDTAERQYYECRSRELLAKRQQEPEDSEEDSGYVATKSLELSVPVEVACVLADQAVPQAANASGAGGKSNKAKKSKKPKDKEPPPKPEVESIALVAVSAAATSNQPILSQQHVDAAVANGGDAKSNSKKSKKKNKSGKDKKNTIGGGNGQQKDKENVEEPLKASAATDSAHADRRSEIAAHPLHPVMQGNTSNRIALKGGSAVAAATTSATGVNAGASKAKGAASNSQCTLVSEIAKAREHIKNSLEKMDGIANLAATPASSDPMVLERLNAVEKENTELRKLVETLRGLCLESQQRIGTLEKQLGGGAAAKKAEAEDDDGVDLFASDSDEESADAARVREERVAAYAAKKSKKPALIAKSSVVLDVKPWDDETDLKALEAEVRKIATDGLLWGAGKLQPVAFGINKLTISCVVEDEKVSIDWLTEEIENMSDYVQSVDVAAFNKI